MTSQLILRTPQQLRMHATGLRPSSVLCRFVGAAWLAVYLLGSSVAASLPANVVLDDLLPENGGDPEVSFVVRGASESVELRDVSSAGDVNGDGIADFMVGSSSFSGNRGAAYVFFGGGEFDQGEVEENSLLAANGGDGSHGFVVLGAEPGNGLRTLGAFNLNGDDFDDIILSANADIASTGSSGEVYVIYGKPKFDAELDVSMLAPSNGGDGSVGVIVTGGGTNAFSAGDVNNDGRDDLALNNGFSNLNGPRSGIVRVVYGLPFGQGPVIDVIGLDPDNGGTGFAGFQIIGDTDDLLGFRPAAAGDFNNDGFDDLIVDAQNRDFVGFADAGAAYLVFGGAGIPAEISIGDLELANGGDGTRGIVFRGETASAGFARSVSGPGDIDGDGVDDVLVGGLKNEFPPSPPFFTRNVVFLGREGALPVETSVSEIVAGTAAIGIEFPYENADQPTSSIVKPAGDPNDDGLDDFLITTVDNFGGQYLFTYLVYGKPGFPDGLVLSDLDPDNGGDGSAGTRFRPAGIFPFFGVSMEGLGDINDDGVDDFAIDDVGPSGASIDRLYVLLGPTQASDTDDDGLPDNNDNCTLVANGDQTDSDLDGYGNACDADLNNDCSVNFTDLGLLKTVFFSSFELADFNIDGAVNFFDLAIMKGAFFGAPGPSGTVTTCGRGVSRR